MKLSRKFYTSLILFSLIGQVAWVVENMYFNVFIYQMFRATAAQISAMVAASAVAATLTTVFIGALSDRIGKRKLFITVGYVLWGISILLFALLRMDILERAVGGITLASSLGVTLVIVFDCIMTFFGSSANDACFNAWVTDCTDDSNRGKVEGFNAMMPLLAILVVFGGAMGQNTQDPDHWSIFFAVIGAVVLVAGILGSFLIDEPKQNVIVTEGYWGNILYGFRPQIVKKHRSLYWTLLGYCVFCISIQIFMPYLILYYTEALHMENYVLIMAPAILIAAVLTAVYGRCFDRFGYVKTLIPALLCLVLGYAILYLLRSTVMVFLGSLLMMTGYLCGCAVFGAKIREATPVGMAGRFQGLRIFGQVLIPGVVGPAIGAWILKGAELVQNADGTTSFIPNANIFLGAAVALVPIVLILVLPKRFDRKEQSHADPV